VRLIRSALVLATAVAVPLIPTAAQADKYTHADATGDVYSTVGEAGTYTAAPDRVEGDIVSSTVRHKNRAVLMQMAYRDLTNDAEYDSHVFFIR